MTTHDVVRIMGQNLADLLDTHTKREDFDRIYSIICDMEGGDVARSWMIGMNPFLSDESPFMCIARGDGRNVEVVARSYVGGHVMGY